MLENLRNYKITLASNSPRRHELLKGLGIDFTIKTLENVDESYPLTLAPVDVAKHIAQKKADAYKELIGEDELLITADTVVVANDEILGKPKDRVDAQRMLSLLSGITHEVVTGVCIVTKEKTILFDSKTEVTFSKLSESEINYYIDTFAPYDKAGAYGIQEWIGFVAVESMAGSYFNVMGLPIQRLYRELLKV
ncbi:Maf-like protein [Bacteroides propionicifaciens]|jgi:septum formation protein|uniref:Maf-like protein n=1 Tax=Bacteroides propionicifaciens TaxID=392838 RepID=UPI00036B711A|nr:Maf-like protein [Bacteroides propionicifaciens]